MKPSTSLALILVGLVLLGGAAFFVLSGAGDGGRTSGPGTTGPAVLPSDGVAAPHKPILPAQPLRGPEDADTGTVRRTERVAAPAAGGADAPPVFQVWRGSVVSDQRPIEGAHLILYEGDLPVRETRAKADGTFELRLPVALTKPRLGITARGFAENVRVLPATRPGELRLLGNLKLQQARFVSGKVLNPDGRPSASAQIMLESATTGRGRNRAVLRTTTGADGTFRIPNAMPGSIWVTARNEGFGEARTRFAEGTKILVKLDTESTWTVAIVTRDGAPVPNAQVELSGGSGAPARRETTDRAGRVTFGGLGSNGRPRATITHKDFYPQTLQSVAVGGENEITLRDLPSIRGIVLRRDREPVPPGTQVRVSPAGVRTQAAGTGTTVSLRDGTYTIKGVKPGRWVIEAQAPGFSATKSDPFVVSPEGQTTAPTVALRRGGIVAFEVFGGDELLPNVKIELFNAYPDERLLLQPGIPGAALPARVGGSGGEGSVILREMPPGSWWSIVRADGYVAKLHGPLDSSEGQRTEAKPARLDRAGSIAGQVKNTDGAPLRATIVANYGATELRLASSTSGEFNLTELPAGVWMLTVHSLNGKSSGPRRIEVKAGEAAQADFEL